MNYPVITAGAKGAFVLFPEGVGKAINLKEAGQIALKYKPIVCHGRALAAKLGLEHFSNHDVLELFAFTFPGKFVVPTISGLCEYFGQEYPQDLAEECLALRIIATKIIAEIGEDKKDIAQVMRFGAWSWGDALKERLDLPAELPYRGRVLAALRVWEKLPEWEDAAPMPPPGDLPVSPQEAQNILQTLLRADAEPRPQQQDFAAALTFAFNPRDDAGEPSLVLAEAGTGTGKTLGYIAPALSWARKNQGTVWISTYTRNLQRQLEAELDRAYPDPEEKKAKVVVRKGRENYLCLLNFEEAVESLPSYPNRAVPLALIALWAKASDLGDLSGADFPGWLVELLGPQLTLGLGDRRGECIYSACSHYSRCFAEKSIRRAKYAEIVVANHALVLRQAASGRFEGQNLRLIFDEGHHLFEAADSAFASHLTLHETQELRRWLLGGEEGRSSRLKGLKKRLEGIIEDSQAGSNALLSLLNAARLLPAFGARLRIKDGEPFGLFEEFLAAVRAQVTARTNDNPYGLETSVEPLSNGLKEIAIDLEKELAKLEEPLNIICRELGKMLGEKADELDSPTRLKIEGLIKSLQYRALNQVRAWRGMLSALQYGQPEEYADWFGVERIHGEDFDLGMYRHWLDPGLPLAVTVYPHAHGVGITSATLRDGSGNIKADWQAALDRTGAGHMAQMPQLAAFPSPFPYPDITQVIIVNDVRKDNLDAVAAAYRELFIAAHGGALGLFTAISRLKGVYERIAPALEEHGLPLLAQHIGGMDPATLVEIFRHSEHSCLLGTDALRDGVDVPGRSLHLLVFDRVPWPRPDILHRSRKQVFGARSYDDMIARLRLKQAFGRLIRKKTDRGVFVLLDPMMPSRLFGAFPEGVNITKTGLRDALGIIKGFLG